MRQGLKQFKQHIAEWEGASFNDIQDDELQIKSDHFHKLCVKCSKNLPKNPILDELKALVDDFKNTVPIISALRNPALKQVHWNDIFVTIKKKIKLVEIEIFMEEEEMNSMATGASPSDGKSILQKKLLAYQ